MKNTVIFDLDGTLLNTLDDLCDCMNAVLRDNGFPERTYEEIRAFVGNGIRKLAERSVPAGTSPEQTEAVLQQFLPYYELHCFDKTVPYDGVPEMMETLKSLGYKTAIVSNKADGPVKELAEHFFKDLVVTAVGERPPMKKKPAPDMVCQVLKELDSKKEETLYVGDSEVDVETAANAEVDLIAVTWGFRDKVALAGAGAVCFADSPGELLIQITKWKD